MSIGFLSIYTSNDFLGFSGLNKNCFFVLFLNHNINDDYNYRKDRNGVANGKTLSISKRFYLLHNFNSYIGSSIENKK